MTARTFRLAALCLTSALLTTVALAETPDVPATAPDAGQRMGHHAHAFGRFHHVLRQLDLTAEQKTQIKAIFTQTKSGMQSRIAAMHANHEALMSAAPTDPGYPALLATEKANAADRVQALSDIKSQIYAVLTPEQQAKIPQILAADKAAHEAKMAAWRANHPTT